MSLFKPKTQEELDAKKARLDELESEANAGKRLQEVDKTYREGLTTLRDLIAPAALDFQGSHFELNGKFARSFFVLAYPRFLSSNWLSSIINAEGALDVSLFIYPIDSETILKKLKSKGKKRQRVLWGELLFKNLMYNKGKSPPPQNGF